MTLFDRLLRFVLLLEPAPADPPPPRPGRIVDLHGDPGPILYSADSLQAADAIAGRLGRILKRRSADLAGRDGRRLVTHEDVWAALDEMGWPVDWFDEPGEEPCP